MLRIKKQLPLATINEAEYKKNQDEIKNSIKNLFISNNNKKKTINEYATLTTQIREEYAKLQTKCVQLEKTLQRYKDYIENRWTPPVSSNIQRKRVFRKPKIPYNQDNDIEGYISEVDDEDNQEYFDYESKPKPKRKKRIVYVDEIDGNDYDDDDDDDKEKPKKEEEDEDEYVRVIKKRKKPVGKKPPNKELSKKIGITKSI